MTILCRLFAGLVLCGIAYHLLAILACLRFRRRRPALLSAPADILAVSILKPVRGRDPGFYEAIRSHASLRYPAGFELLFGVSDPHDPAREAILRLQQEFPAIPIRIIETSNDAANGKVGSLEILMAQAQHGIIVLSDSDIAVEPEYLSSVVGALSRPGVGLVTCLYRGHAVSTAAKAECLGITTEFAPSVLVADLLSASTLAFGSTIALRRGDLEAIGGFRAIRNYLADDYQLGARVAKLGKQVVLCDQVVETSMGDGAWKAVWNHQLRWSRTIRVSNPSGYFGYAVTQLIFWSILAALCGWIWLPLAGLAVRMLSALSAVLALHDRRAARHLYAVPFRDLFGTAVWASALLGDTVEWRGLRFRLFRDGTISPLP